MFGTSNFLSRFSYPSRLSQALPTVPAASVTDADEDNGRRSRRMLKRFRLFTRPTLARRDAPFPKQCRIERSL